MTNLSPALKHILGDPVVYESWADDPTEQEAINSSSEDVIIGMGEIERAHFYGDTELANWYLPDLLCWSDYAGSTVERSNCRSFLRMFGDVAGVHRVIGGYGTEGVLIYKGVLVSRPDIAAALESLDDYLILDEDDCSDLERELQDDVYNSDDFVNDIRREMKKRYPDSAEFIDDELTDEQIREWFDAAYENGNIEWICEDAVSAYIDIEKVVNEIEDLVGVFAR